MLHLQLRCEPCIDAPETASHTQRTVWRYYAGLSLDDLRVGLWYPGKCANTHCQVFTRSSDLFCLRLPSLQLPSKTNLFPSSRVKLSFPTFTHKPFCSEHSFVRLFGSLNKCSCTDQESLLFYLHLLERAAQLSTDFLHHQFSSSPPFAKPPALELATSSSSFARLEE
jgi:hypothetical protein